MTLADRLERLAIVAATDALRYRTVGRDHLAAQAEARSEAFYVAAGMAREAEHVCAAD